MKSEGIMSSLFFLGLGISVSAASFSLDLGKAGEPGPGFLPFVAGIVLSGLSGALLVGSISSKSSISVSKDSTAVKQGKNRILLALSALIVYTLIMPYAGFLISSFLFVLFLMRTIEPQGWLPSFTMAALSVAMSYIFFCILLNVQLPHGSLIF